MRACALPVADADSISEVKEMIIFLFAYFFYTDSATNTSWPRLDADLSRFSVLLLVKSRISARMNRLSTF